MTGIIDNQSDDKSKGSRSLRLSGRDLAGLLVDCSAPQLNVKGMTMLAAAKKLVEPWPQIAKVELRAEKMKRWIKSTSNRAKRCGRH